MPKHYENKKRKKRKATPFDGVAAHGMSNSFKKLTAPKPPKPKPPKPPEPKRPKTELAPPRNRRTGEDYLDWTARKEKKKKQK